MHYGGNEDWTLNLRRNMFGGPQDFAQKARATTTVRQLLRWSSCLSPMSFFRERILCDALADGISFSP